MFILQTLFLFEICTTNVYAQRYRVGYMWAQSYKTFYKLHDIATNWNKARQVCEAEGATLFIPSSLEEVENFKILLSNMKAHYKAVFIGLHDQFSEGDFVTLSGDPIAGTILDILWAEGRPDNADGKEDCVVMTREGLLDDRRCDDIYPYACKIKLDVVKYNEKCDVYDMDYVLENNGKCYKFHEEPLCWHDAYMVCQAEGAQLVVVKSAEEASLVTSFLGEHLDSSAPNQNILYVGFSDLMFPYQYRTIEGQSLEDAGYTSWSPFAKEQNLDSEERCGVMSRTGFLTVGDCSIPAMFMCEKSINNTQLPVKTPPATKPQEKEKA